MRNFTLFLVLFLTVSQVLNAQQRQNLLTNPSGETGDLTGWGITAENGDGWGFTPNLGVNGSACFRTSYGWCGKQTTINLVEKGYSTDWLDTAPIVLFSDYIKSGTSGSADDDYYLSVFLLDENFNSIAQYHTGNILTTPNWQQIKGSLKDYGPGLRYIVYEHAGKDNEFWGGHFGAYIDASYLSIGNHLYYSGGHTSDFAGWDVTASGGDGWGLADPEGIYGYHMYTTSYDWVGKTQTVDLMDYGYTAAELNQQPLINSWNWVIGLAPNHSDLGYTTIKLLNENMNVLAEYSDTIVCTDQWQFMGSTFTNYGTGLRYVSFTHGGKDAEFWAGHYGAVFDDAELILDFSITNAAKEPVDETTQMSISPNPSNGVFTVSWENNQTDNARIQVSTLTGQQILEKVAVRNGGEVIDLSRFPAGLYLVQFRSEFGVVTKRVVIQ